MSEKLKPCPFCGGEIKLLGSDYYSTNWFFECEKDKIKVTMYKRTKASAIKAWNRRAK